MKYLLNAALGAVFVVTAFCLNVIYGNGLIGFVMLMAFTFISILIVIAGNLSDLSISNSLTTFSYHEFVIQPIHTTFQPEINKKVFP